MQKIIGLFFTFSALLAACTTQSASVATPPLAASPEQLSSTIETPTKTATLAPSATLTPTPATSTPAPLSITPLPTIPTFTPTFDVRTIVTATPAPKAECPQSIPAQNPDIGFLDFSFEKQENRANSEEIILDFLNRHGLDSFSNVLRAGNWKNGMDYTIQDFTNDGLPDIIIRGDGTYVFGCVAGKYKTLFVLPPDGYLMPPAIENIADGNHNNIPEIVFLTAIKSQGARIYRIYEWTGNHFSNLIPSEYPDAPEEGEIFIEVNGKIDYRDIDNYGILELVTESGIPRWTTYYDGLPLRNKTTEYKWNGRQYIPATIKFTPPEFRFQAIQDGDLAVNQQEYARAMDLYQQTIFDVLKDYSPEIRENLQDNWQSAVGEIQPSPTPVASDPTEYPRLAAYAYYRMVILHIHLGEMDAAEVKYATLQEKFPANSPGHPYVEMATDFWNAYQASGKMYDACAAAIAYADTHPKILVPLGSDYHGAQSHTYVPADVCPFR